MRFLMRCLFVVVAMSASVRGVCDPELVFTSIDQTPITSMLEDRLRRAYHDLGYSIRVVVLPSRRALALADSGYFDGELFRIGGVSADHPRLLRVPFPLAQGRLMAITLDPTIQDWRPDAIGKRRVGIRRGILIAERATADLNTIEVNNFQQMLKLLHSGRIDVGIITEIEGQLSISSEEKASVRLLYSPVATFNLYHYVHRRNRAMVSPLTLILERMAVEAAEKDR